MNLFDLGFNYIIENYDPDFSTSIEDYVDEESVYNEEFMSGVINGIFAIDESSDSFGVLVEAYSSIDLDIFTEDAATKDFERTTGRKLSSGDKTAYRQAIKRGMTPTEAVKHTFGKEVADEYSTGRKLRERKHRADLAVSRQREAARQAVYNGETDAKARAKMTAAGIDKEEQERLLKERAAANKANKKTKGERGVGQGKRHNAKKNSQDAADNRAKADSNRTWRSTYDTATTTDKGKKIVNANQSGTHSGEVSQLATSRAEQAKLDAIGKKHIADETGKASDAKEAKAAGKKAARAEKIKQTAPVQRDELAREVKEQKIKNRQSGNSGQDAGNQVVAQRVKEGRSTPTTKGVAKPIAKAAERVNAENAAKKAKPTPPSVKASSNPTPPSVKASSNPTPPSVKASSNPTPPSPSSPSNPITRTPGGNKYPAYNGTGKKNNKAIKIAGGIAAGTAAVTGAVILEKKIKEHREYKKWLASHKKTKEQVPFSVWKSKYAVKAVAESFEYDVLNENVNTFVTGSLDALCENGTINDNFELGMISYYVEEFIERDINYLEAYYEAFLEEFDNLTEYENSYEAYCEGYYLALQ